MGECQTGLVPISGMVVSWVLEFALLLVVITIPATLARMQPYTPLSRPKYDVIYFSGESLPQTTDTSGSQAGHSGRSGGRAALHRRQVIKVSRGDSLAEKIVDAPKLKLPRSSQAVANLIAITAKNPGPPPTAGLKALSKPKLLMPQDAIAPQPKVTRDRLAAMPMVNPTAIAPEVAVSRDKLLNVPELKTAVVQPAPSTTSNEMLRVKAPEITMANAVPPPVSAPYADTNTNPKLALPPPTVVQPPADATLAHEVWSVAGSIFGEGKKDVIPPPVQPVGSPNGTASTGAMAGAIAGASQVVAPVPQLGGGTGLRNAGTAHAGGALAALSSGVSAPAGSGGNANSSGVVMSMEPGKKVGMPGNAGSGSLAMSKVGGDRPGLGGSGDGAGTGKGMGSGSGSVGEGSGATSTGTGFGASRTAHSGISSGPGHGGAGTGGGSTSMAGVSIRGGVVNLPSFGPGANSPNVPGRMPREKGRVNPAITIIATPRSGGATNLYGSLKGDKVYTIYIDTRQGTAILQYADPSTRDGGFDEDLTAPEPVRAELPAGIKKVRMLISCTMDRSGLLRNLKVIEGSGSELHNKLMAALSNWRFRPVLRGNDPIEVEAIVGFNIDTR